MRFMLRNEKLERVTGIGPVSLPWQGSIIATIRYPLNGMLQLDHRS
ncbi:MAG: hypothetical protein QG570_654 [Patescibacteria group bacterium]|nr:hypothetical protein [Patescibacteria group bacterium]